MSELERTTELRGAGKAMANLPHPATDWQRELELVRLELDAEQAKHAAELRRHEERVYDLLRRKSDALRGCGAVDA